MILLTYISLPESENSFLQVLITSVSNTDLAPAVCKSPRLMCSSLFNPPDSPVQLVLWWCPFYRGGPEIQRDGLAYPESQQPADSGFEPKSCQLQSSTTPLGQGFSTWALLVFWPSRFSCAGEDVYWHRCPLPTRCQ